MTYRRVVPENPYAGYLCPECGQLAVSWSEESYGVHNDAYELIALQPIKGTLGCKSGHEWLIYLDDDPPPLASERLR